MINYHAIAQASKASQDKEELEELLKTVGEISPKVVIEIGAWHGYSAETWIRAFDLNTLIALEIDEDCEFLGLEDPGDTNAIYVWGADSNDPTTALKTQQALMGKKVDFLFIDGDHHYEAVKKDFELYSPLVRPGGIVAFHDARITDNYACEVYKFWNEIKGQYKHKEIFSSTGTGTGVLFL